jgi:AraC-like DNA-binding protein/transcriptional regulator with XRE-family HTH domain
MVSQQTFPASFGELLKALRKRTRLTQKQLAQQLGVHANTISSWELGSYLPATRGLVLELARHLALDEQETRHLLEASLTALAPHWLVPLPRNPFFTGREEILETVHTRLYAGQVVALTQSSALHGLGGIGKTQLALEYAYRHALEYSAVFWIAAETVESIVASLLRIAELLVLPERQEADQQRIVAEVQRWLGTHSRWLLIWDNVEDLELLHGFLPPARQGAILITTRCQVLGTLAVDLELSPLSQGEGMLLLLRRAKVLEPEAGSRQIQQLAQRLPAEYAAAEQLVTAMDGLPLALEQAGAAIEETRCSLADYQRWYEQQSHQLVDRRRALGVNHPVIATPRLACQRAAQRQPAALDLLHFPSALKDPPASPLLYLSSEEAGWEGLVAQAFHEPMELEGWMTTAMPDIALILFAGGAMRIEQRHANGPWKVFYLRQGDLILRPGVGTSYEMRWKGLSSVPTQTLHLRLSKDLLARTAEEVAGCDPAHLSVEEHSGFQDPLLTQIGLALWRELEQPAPAGKLYAQSAAHMLAIHLLRSYTAVGAAIEEPSQGLTHQQVQRVLDFVQAHLSQELSLEALAQQIGLSPYHFARLFRQTTGESPHQFVLRQRIERAQRLLQERDVSLAHVAGASGFANQSHLTQAFKRHLGLTPQAYRGDRSS